MKKIIVDKCPACDPVNNLIEKLTSKGYKILESKLEDYHFHQLYFNINATIDIARELHLNGFEEKDNFFICKCHWSRIEFKKA